MPKPVRYTAAVLTIAVLAGCGGNGEVSEPPEPPVTTIPVVTSEADVTLPLTDYVLPSADHVRVDRARTILRQRCAERFGTRYTMDRPADPPADTIGRRYGIVDQSTVERFGYQRAVDPVRNTPIGPDKKWRPDDREYLVITGKPRDGRAPQADPTDAAGRPLPPGGCGAEAERVLSQGLPEPADVVSGLDQRAFQLGERDSRTQAAWRAWSACMSAAGHRYGSPWEPNDAAWGDSVGEAELRTARADVACRRRTNLVGIWLAVERAYQERLIADNRTAFDRVRRYLDTRVHKAAAVTGSGA